METVRRMMAECVEDSRDERVLRGFGFSDLSMDTVESYRNRFAAVKPGHVWTDLALPDFLERIGAFGKNREENYSGLRLAGLLMFGRAEVIRDELPHYMADYQERPETKAGNAGSIPGFCEALYSSCVPAATWDGMCLPVFCGEMPTTC